MGYNNNQGKGLNIHFQADRRAVEAEKGAKAMNILLEEKRMITRRIQRIVHALTMIEVNELDEINGHSKEFLHGELEGIEAMLNIMGIDHDNYFNSTYELRNIIITSM